jgi:antitoxin component HigA of HigAB toxin-antitoxin module
VRLGGHDDPDAPIQLYDMETDPNEEHDVAADNPDGVAVVRAVMESRTKSDVPRWNFAVR